MTLQVWYWLFMALWLISGLFSHWPVAAPADARAWLPLGSSLILFILFLLLGFAVFGSPIKA